MRILHGAPIEHARRARSNPSAFDAFDPAATDFKIGNGIPNKVVALRGNSTLRLADPRNLIVAMLDGIGAVNSRIARVCRRYRAFPISCAMEKWLRLRTICASPGVGSKRYSSFRRKTKYGTGKQQDG
jgi:hypothetical protein